MSGVEILNKQIDLLFQFWDGKISETEFENQRIFGINEETDQEMQRDSFY